ncbi:carnitine operon protein CaiE [Nitratireductor aestuarii]|uniref:Carnitine operon protein CaiE n=1 Tax=Nitratireductor aestuarii TaxID=1735103 RepID=A0A916W3R3_9HYPH|nr:DapH/DapD/GlmU-related protein [Nitratireductor aestuarii]GGA63463.1 carnitine operon protein CaiE [Nitratireductor aestuarii]
MPCYSFEGIRPVVHPTSFLHPTASLIGDVIVGPGCYIGAGASLRGDFGRIIVEGDTSIQDNCTLHTGSGSDCVIKRGATVGHGAVVHGATIGENALVGMNTVVLDDAEIGAESLIGAMSLVKSDMRAPARSLIAGNPAKIIREMPAEAIKWKNDGQGEYQRLARMSFTDFAECEPLTEVEPERRRVSSTARAVRLNTR